MKYIKIFENFNEGGKISTTVIDNIKDTCFLELIDNGFEIKFDQIGDSFEIKIQYPDDSICKKRIINLSEIKDEILSSISFIESEFTNIKFESIEVVSPIESISGLGYIYINDIEQASEDEYFFWTLYISFKSNTN